jgi:hypothetical protein
MREEKQRACSLWPNMRKDSLLCADVVLRSLPEDRCRKSWEESKTTPLTERGDGRQWRKRCCWTERNEQQGIGERMASHLPAFPAPNSFPGMGAAELLDELDCEELHAYEEQPLKETLEKFTDGTLLAVQW